jgi:SAM-dependent methyltransferase
MDDHVVDFVRQHLRTDGEPTSLLDVGCGSGRLLLRLQDEFDPKCEGRLRLFGLDVSDSGVQLEETFLAVAESRLVARFPAIPWRERLTSTESQDPWPYPDRSFDIIISNQVLEHVFDQAQFLSQHARTLKADGFGLHLFPLKEVIMEWHVGVPLIHRFPQALGLRAARAWSAVVPTARLAPRGRLEGESASQFARRSCELVEDATSYISEKALRTAAEASGLSLSFSGTTELYANRLRRMFRRPARTARFAPSALDRAFLPIAKRISSVSVVLSKAE